MLPRVLYAVCENDVEGLEGPRAEKNIVVGHLREQDGLVLREGLLAEVVEHLLIDFSRTERIDDIGRLEPAELSAELVGPGPHASSLRIVGRVRKVLRGVALHGEFFLESIVEGPVKNLLDSFALELLAETDSLSSLDHSGEDIREVVEELAGCQVHRVEASHSELFLVVLELRLVRVGHVLQVETDVVDYLRAPIAALGSRDSDLVVVGLEVLDGVYDGGTCEGSDCEVRELVPEPGAQGSWIGPSDRDPGVGRDVE